MNTTIIKKNYKHDSMTLLAKFPSGASLKFSVNRNGEDLALAFSNDREVLKQQSKEVNNWLKLKGSETNQERFNRLEQLCLKVKSGANFMSEITTKQLTEKLERLTNKKVTLKENTVDAVSSFYGEIEAQLILDFIDSGAADDGGNLEEAIIDAIDYVLINNGLTYDDLIDDSVEVSDKLEAKYKNYGEEE